jgi:hypothetical protein
MLRLTFCAIVLVTTATTTAYFYLPTPAPTPVATATKPAPMPGNERERFYRETGEQPPETFVPLGLIALGIIWFRSLKA